MTDRILSGRIALVTGGAAGIGAAIARGLADMRARVAVVDITPLPAEATSRERDVHGFTADVRDPGAVDDVCRAIADQLGTPTILVNNAGGCGEARCTGIEDVTDDGWDLVLSLNLGAIMRFSRALVPGMKAAGEGRIINIGSSLMHGQFGGAGTAPALLPYVAAKSGIAGLTRQLAYDLGPDGITVNAVVPGLTLPGAEANLTKRFNALPDAEKAKLTDMVPIGRLGSGEDMANAVSFLASPASGYVTGQLLTVAGGA